MSLRAGARLGPYEILSALGAGGMGEVWRARDTRLDRDVALKVLPAAFVADPERLARFEREAKLLASLNHPHIGGIYGLEEAHEDGRAVKALVLELVEGPTLADRIARGPIPIDEALPIARQIAEALEAAHEQGIVHRDLKPANIKVRPDGTVKVLDFGLAKALEPQLAAAGADLSDSPTLTLGAATQLGVILGTAAYMAPEQARGRPVDKRADIWAFGVVLFEMLAGARAFPGDDVSQTLARVIDREPSWEALQPSTPRRVVELLRRCLRKEPRQRLRDIGDARLELEDVLAGGAIASETSAPEHVGARSWSRALPWGVAALSIVAAATVLIASRHEEDHRATPTRAHLQIQLPEGLRLAVDTAHPTLALSPDGSGLVFVAEDGTTRRLYLRELASREARVIDGTEGAASPFFSPDGKWIGFFAGFTLMRVSATSGAPVAVHTETPVSVNRGGTWLGDWTVILAASVNSGLSLGTIEGDEQRAIADWSPLIDPTAASSWPHAMPGGRKVLFTNDADQRAESARVAILTLDTRETHRLAMRGTNARYSPTGHVLYGRRGALYAVPFDLERAEATGVESRVLANVVSDGNGSVQYTVADNGTIAYVSAPHTTGGYELVWIDREGRTETLLESDEPLAFPRLSPDASRAALTKVEGSNLDVWLFDLERRTLTARLTTDPGEDSGAVWHADGRRLAIASEEGRRGPGIALLHEDPGSSRDLLPGTFEVGSWEFPSSFTPDGVWLAYVATRGSPVGDILALPLPGRGEPRSLVATPFDERGPAISPDGRWLAYVSSELGRYDVYVVPFLRPGERKQVSSRGGTEPLWSPRGDELFYREGSRLMVTHVDGSGERFVVGETLVRVDDLRMGEWSGFGADAANYDVSRDGERILLVRRRNPVTATVIDVVLNWPETLGVSAAPTGR
jgi:serine/threonine protein kinase/Tol biopolymer transport system component